PVQTPVDELEGVERARRPPVEEQIPLDVLRCAVGWNLAYPLALAMRRVAAHPRFDVRNPSDQPVVDPFLRIEEGAAACKLQSYLHRRTGLPGRVTTGVGLGNRPRYFFLEVQVLARGQSVQEMPRVTVERARNDPRIDVLHVEQPPMVGDRLHFREVPPDL